MYISLLYVTWFQVRLLFIYFFVTVTRTWHRFLDVKARSQPTSRPKLQKPRRRRRHAHGRSGYVRLPTSTTSLGLGDMVARMRSAADLDLNWGLCWDQDLQTILTRDFQISQGCLVKKTTVTLRAWCKHEREDISRADNIGCTQTNPSLAF